MTKIDDERFYEPAPTREKRVEDWVPWASYETMGARAINLRDLWLFSAYVDNWNNWSNGRQPHKPNVADFEIRMKVGQGVLSKARAHVEEYSQSYVMDLFLTGSAGKGKARVARSLKEAKLVHSRHKGQLKAPRDKGSSSKKSEDRGPKTNGDVREVGQLWAQVGRVIYELLGVIERIEYVPEFIDFLEVWAQEIKGIKDPDELKKALATAQMRYQSYWESEGMEDDLDTNPHQLSDEELADLERARWALYDKVDQEDLMTREIYPVWHQAEWSADFSRQSPSEAAETAKREKARSEK